jgi:hypothetical protein
MKEGDISVANKKFGFLYVFNFYGSDLSWESLHSPCKKSQKIIFTATLTPG